jgi:CRISPR-associated endonuclease/helicase Cas3
MVSMANLYLAKSKPRETIVEHTDQVVKQFQHLKACYPKIPHVDWEILYLACLYHDLGKMNSKFQNKIQKEIKLNDPLSNKEEIPHGYLSAAFLPLEELKKKYDRNTLRVLYQAIYYHHSRPLVSFENVKEVVQLDLPQQMQEFNYEKLPYPLTINSKYAKYAFNGRIPTDIDDEETVKKYIMTKGLLNRLDYAASADSSNIGKGSPLYVEDPNVDLLEKTVEYVHTKGELNELQTFMLNHQNDNNVVIASTGIGKTESALCWIGNNKGFFTLPLKVSINAIYDRIKQEIGFENTGLLHSDMPAEYLKRHNEKEESFDMTMIDKTKQLCMPLTVCTLDQLIDFVFKYRGFEQKLATLAYAKMVIDEIQMYSPELVGYLIVGLKQITELGGKFTIMTATFPPVFEHFMKRCNIPYKKRNQPFLKVNKAGKPVVRHKVEIINDDISIDSILPNIRGKKVLIIVNTVKKAQELYDRLQAENIENLHMLHSRFIQKDRSNKEAAIFNLGKRTCNETGVWVTTQIVEASLDIDFDVLYTELSEVSGLLQRMGRIYRGRELQNETTNVYVYTGNPNPSGIRNSKKSIVDYHIFCKSKEHLKSFHGKILTEKMKMQLVDQVYSVESLKDSTYYETLKNTVDTFIDLKAYEFDKKDVRLRDIENETIIPSSVYRHYEEEILKCQQVILESDSWIDKMKALNELKQFMVAVPTFVLQSARKNSLIEHELLISKYERVYVVSYKYSEETGLLFEEDQESTFF